MSDNKVKIKNLVEKFSEQYDSYKSPFYNETQLRREFLDPFFEALGWDVDNRQGYAEAYKDVIHEDSIKIGGFTKAPDYGFRIGGVKKFFVEAKKPSVNLNSDTKPAFQLKRYAWSAKLPISILTDFEEFIIYDTRNKPNQSDPAVKSRIDYFKFTDYPNRWDEIHSIFSKEAILKGSFDKFIEDKKLKHGTNEVDNEFLKEIDKWREALAKDIATNNKSLTIRDLNFAVQKTIDRIIFLRICEDRSIETYGKLLGLQNGQNIYKRLVETFREADQRYNSGLFHFREEKGVDESPDTLTPNLEVSDHVLRDIIKTLYYPNSPYEFSVLPLDVLGHVYEQFLGKVIRLENHKAIVEEKPEVKKAGGVYYTPTFVVDYIVKNTVGKLLEGKTPKQIEKIKILDPACGSGSFLIGAYEYLLDWHRDYYTENLSEKYYKSKNPIIFQFGEKDWRLTTAEKKRILLNNIFGVDIDSQAVEVTKLSLLFKVLEGENQETLNRQLTLLHERALPDLSSNIKCGNSVVASDFYEESQKSLFDLEDKIKINTFDWKSEFSEIMGNGGFDVVIGNPPYIRIQNLQESSPKEVEYFKRHYKSASSGNYDIYVVFIEKGLGLLNTKGLLGFILPHKFFNAQYGEPIRKLLSEGKHLSKIIHFGDLQIFKNATTYTCLLFLDKKKTSQLEHEKVKSIKSWLAEDSSEKSILDMPNSKEWNFSSGKGGELFAKLNNYPVKLGKVTRIFQGLVTGLDKVFILEGVAQISNHEVRVKDQKGKEYSLEHGLLKPFIKKITVSTYEKPYYHHWIIFPYILEGGEAKLISSEALSSTYPKTWRYLKSKESILRSRERNKWDHDKWYAFGRTQNLVQMQDPKLIIQVVSKTGKYAYDGDGIYFTGGGNGPYYGLRWKDAEYQLSLHYLQAILGSPLLDFCLRRISSPFRGGYWSYGKRFIEKLPIKIINLSNPGDKDNHDNIVSLVNSSVELNNKLQKTNVDHDKAVLERQIKSVKQRINGLIYELYGLTQEEIKIVEVNNE